MKDVKHTSVRELLRLENAFETYEFDESRAVCQFAAEVERPIWTSMAKAIICKDPRIGFDLTLTKRRKIKVL